ncbi:MULTISPECIES: GlxA family transcriptional regulator [unclassified Mycobacterium]|uniref:GlxA family transcriptional regulator n=1 Tax=unclassified Mycobacterium TaxID=2642494 RepID=UPI0029C60632|nr:MULTISPECIES: helix-turn-helix domain-containing protein [unclassified Mycobacterium]
MHVGVMAVPACWDSGLVTILDVLRGANTARFQIDRDLPAFEVSTVGTDSEPVRTAGGLLVPIDLTTEDLGALDLLVVPALTMNTPGGIVDVLLRDDVRAARNAVREWARSGLPLAAACTGTFLLADAGVLDARHATTSWWLVDEFRRRYPRVALDMSQMVIADGSITTAGAAFAHIDLAMHIVASVSAQLADATAALLLFDERPARSVGAAQSYLATADALVMDFEAWVRANLERDISIPEAAHAIGTTRRTLERRVRDRLGVTPYALVQRLRVERAHHLRQTTSLTLDQIAPLVGYASAAALRKPLRASRRGAVGPVTTLT